MKNDIPNIQYYLHTSKPNLLYEFHHIVINFIKDFTGTLRSIFADYFWRTFGTQKMHISQYVCKTCLNPSWAGVGLVGSRPQTF